MQDLIDSVETLEDTALIEAVKSLSISERHATARLVMALAEMERRRLYVGQGCSSLYDYCVQILQMSEDAAYSRSRVARLGVQYPVILRDLESGAISLTALRIVAPCLTPENYSTVLAAVRYKPKRDAERLVAVMHPELDPDQRAMVTQIGPDRYRVEFTASQELHDKLRHAQDLLRHAVPSGDLAVVIERAVDALVTNLERTRMAATSRPGRSRMLKAGSRRIPARVTRAVWRRDGSRCAFIGTEGRCTSTAFLEVHHILPFAEGGAATVDNLELRCRKHNQYEAERWFGWAGQGAGPPSRDG